MLSTVASKPNHYERLGLESDAGEEAIARAFAREMSALRPHSVGDMAQIALAFETLRDPARRRAYDASIAPPPEPEPEPQARPAMFPREGWPFIASARIGSADLPTIDSVARTPSARPFRASPTPSAVDEPSQPASALAEPEKPKAFAALHVLDEHFSRKDGRTGWRRPTVTLGALFAGVAILGAGLGVYASRGIDPAQAQDVATVTLPESAESAVPRPLVAEPAVKASLPKSAARRAAARRERARPAPKPAADAEQRVEEMPDIPSEQVAALTSETALVSAEMPLPSAIVARTIDRIGYSCGQVTSTSAAGVAGVFKVTCTSGNSFKATPIRGRYHFRRWGS